MTDDLDALFEEVSAQRTQATTTAAQAVTAAAADGKLASDIAYDNQDKQDQPMYTRLGGIVRLLHDSLRELGYDRTLSDAASQITDAQGRLEHIAALTEQAANRVLNTIDQGIPEQEAVLKSALEMDSRWTRLFEGTMSIEEFRELATDSKAFALKVASATETEKARLLDIMMAQDFQDITGQLIKKIVSVTQKVETELAQLLLDNAPPEVAQSLKDAPESLMQGPSTSALGQDDVDSLLEGLGF
ncbi:protein phosphatase CheZ [Noviherbaspirillum sedimenti]|uniref:Protein phosphatase CheZ n=1 Tax=Noviherbaspirillum sedimenti TaxID=2320865 RepID=A0A3A3G1G6_9BURK|nr:protein phosphatase CheZ [Noviherbaspirillum sedimenti]RJG01475.1 protein phosphatase CheZ [Noviherbaspirillum sedimenti]